MNNKWHIGIIYSAIIATVGVLAWFDGRYALASDIEQKETEFVKAIQNVNFTVEQNSISLSKSITDMRLLQYADKIDSGKELSQYQKKEFDFLMEERQRLDVRQEQLNRDRMSW